MSGMKIAVPKERDGFDSFKQISAEQELLSEKISIWCKHSEGRKEGK